MTPWHIFPVGPRTKEPLAPIELATNDKEQIDFWSIKFPGCNWGVALEASGLLVLDVDCKDGAKGFESLAKLPEIGATLTVRTPSGGRHFYFKYGSGSIVEQLDRPIHNFLPGIDLPAWVLIGGSSTAAGNYRVEESDAVADVPQWLLENMHDDYSGDDSTFYVRTGQR